MKKLKDLKLGVALTREQMKNTQGGGCSHMGWTCGYYDGHHTHWGQCDLFSYNNWYYCWCTATPQNAELSGNGGNSHCES